MKKNRPKIIAIVGPTATGKSDLAVFLAKKFNGEIISADSRQVYKGLNIGTGKITKKEMSGIRHHLLDVVSPAQKFSVSAYKTFVDNAIIDILSRGKLPILCGGTGFYISAVINNVSFPEVKADLALRKILEAKPPKELYTMLQKLDPRRAKEMDPYNKVRLIRAIEIAKALGEVPKIKKNPVYDALQIGLSLPNDELRKRIGARLDARLKNGMLAEAKRLHTHGLSWRRMEELGLEYRFLTRHLQRKISASDMRRELETEIWHYARRQMTWFNANKKIQWFAPIDQKKIISTIETFLS